MPRSVSANRESTRLLLKALSEPWAVNALSESEWDLLVRVARVSNLLGTVHARIEEANAMDHVPQVVQVQLRSEWAATAYRTRLVSWELDRLARALGRLSVPVVLLKGAAYIVQGLACAAGRAVSDVDILVPRERLPEVEQALLSHGWEATPLEPYDDRYYRQWSHEIPPLRYGGSALELDVHHAILPPLGRIRPDPVMLVGRSVATGETPFRALAREDQVLHAALHLFQDSDCTNRLRDLVDIDALIREFAALPGFATELVARAGEHGASRPLWYALHHATRYLQTPVPTQTRDRLKRHAPPLPVRRLMDWLVGSVLMPPDPDRGYPWTARFASWALRMRSVWLRFPPRLFFLHSIIKAVPWLRQGAARPQAM